MSTSQVFAPCLTYPGNAPNLAWAVITRDVTDEAWRKYLGPMDEDTARSVSAAMNAQQESR